MRDIYRFVRSGKFLEGIVLLPLTASKIEIRNNIRIFGCGREGSWTAKLSLDGSLRSGGFHRELYARNLLSSASDITIEIPKVFFADPKHKRWIIEEEIFHARRDKTLIDKFVATHARSFYGLTSKIKRLGDCAVQGLRVASMPWPAKLEDRFDKHLPVALCHGDLTSNNMLERRNGQLVVVDWELAGVRPVGFDLRHVFRDQPQLREPVLKLLSALGEQSSGCMTATEQMAIALVLDSIILSQRIVEYKKYFENVFGLRSGEAEKRVNKLIDKDLGLAAELGLDYRSIFVQDYEAQQKPV